MLTNRTVRRSVAVLFVVLGGALIFLATEAWAGVLLVVLGVSIELIGIAMKHK